MITSPTIHFHVVVVASVLRPFPSRPACKSSIARPIRIHTLNPPVDGREQQPGAAVGYQDGDRQYRMVMAPVAPAEDIDAIGADIGKSRRFGKVVRHPDIGK